MGSEEALGEIGDEVGDKVLEELTFELLNGSGRA